MACLMNAALALPESVTSTPPYTALASLATAALVLYLEEARTQGLQGQGVGAHPAVVAARESVRRHLHAHVTLAAMAEAAHVAPDYLIRLFRHHLHTTPIRYLWEERVRLGTYLLEHTGLPVQEVATRTGFQTTKHFCRRVRAATGLPPREVRRQHSYVPAPSAPAGDQAHL